MANSQYSGIAVPGVGEGWINVELEPGDKIAGEVLRLPTPGAFNGTRLFLRTGDEVVAILATASRGFTLLERALEVRNVAVGDDIEVEFVGWGSSHNGERRYRLIEVRFVDDVGR